jgi:hypothetical protein
MSKARNLSKLLVDSNGDVESGSLDNVPASDDASALTTGTLAVARLPNEGLSLGSRNRIINGDMRIDQRNAGASVTPTNGQYTLDRWKTFMSQSSKFTIQQNAGAVTPPAGFTNYLGVTSTAATSVGAGDFFLFDQRIEGFNVSDLGFGTAAAQSITISFWVRSSLTGTFTGGVINSSNSRVYGFTYAISSANTWEQKTVTIAGDTSGTWLTTNGIGLALIFGFGAGATYTTPTNGSWQAGNYFAGGSGGVSVVGTSGATWYITGIQLEVGSVATPFERRPYGTELSLCQRYYQQHGFYGVIGQGQNTDRNSGSYVSFFVPMRTTPTTIAKDYDVDIGDLNVAFTPLIYTDAIGQGIGWRPYRNVTTTITRGDTMDILANAGTEGGFRHPFNAEL